MVSSYWDHSGKPSLFVVNKGSTQIYKGPYQIGMKVYADLKYAEDKETEIREKKEELDFRMESIKRRIDEVDEKINKIIESMKK